MTLKGGILSTNIEGGLTGGSLNQITLSGSVTVGGVAAVRNILVYSSLYPSRPLPTSSDASGAWSLTVSGTDTEVFKVVCIGEDGANSIIYDKLQAESG